MRVDAKADPWVVGMVVYWAATKDDVWVDS